MQKYIKMFLDSAPALIEKVNAAITINDFEEIANQVHGYKTKWIMMGMTDAKELALRIEQECRQDLRGPSLERDIEMLILQIRQAMTELQSP